MRRCCHCHDKDSSARWIGPRPGARTRCDSARYDERQEVNRAQNVVFWILRVARIGASRGGGASPRSRRALCTDVMAMHSALSNRGRGWQGPRPRHYILLARRVGVAWVRVSSTTSARWIILFLTIGHSHPPRHTRWRRHELDNDQMPAAVVASPRRHARVAPDRPRFRQQRKWRSRCDRRGD